MSNEVNQAMDTLILEFFSNPVVIAIVGIALAGAFWKLAVWYGSVNSDREVFKTFMVEVRDDLKAIRDDVNRIFRILPRPVAESQSPIQLTDFGKTISRSMSAADWARSQSSSLLERAKNKEEFEVFEICGEHVSNMFDNNAEFKKKILAAAYDHGIESERIKRVCQIELRNQLLLVIRQ